jgi:hypothetical protein
VRIFLLTQTTTGYGEAEVTGCVVIAATENTARLIAAANHKDEGREVWTSKNYSNCKFIGTADENQDSGVILLSSRSG